MCASLKAWKETNVNKWLPWLWAGEEGRVEEQTIFTHNQSLFAILTPQYKNK